MSLMDASKVASFAYNPTPMGFGLGIAGAALAGKGGGKNEKLTPTYEGGNYYVSGDKGTKKHLVDTSNYQISGDSGNYNLVPIAGNSSMFGGIRKSAMPSLQDNSYQIARDQLVNDSSALNQFDARFGTPEMNRNANMLSGTVYANQNIAPQNFIKFGQQVQASPIQNLIAKSVYGGVAPQGRNQQDFGLVSRFAQSQNNQVFTPKRLASALVSNGASPQYQAPNIAYQAPK